MKTAVLFSKKSPLREIFSNLCDYCWEMFEETGHLEWFEDFEILLDITLLAFDVLPITKLEVMSRHLYLQGARATVDFYGIEDTLARMCLFITNKELLDIIYQNYNIKERVKHYAKGGRGCVKRNF